MHRTSLLTNEDSASYKSQYKQDINHIDASQTVPSIHIAVYSYHTAMHIQKKNLNPQNTYMSL